MDRPTLSLGMPNPQSDVRSPRDRPSVSWQIYHPRSPLASSEKHRCTYHGPIRLIRLIRPIRPIGPKSRERQNPQPPFPTSSLVQRPPFQLLYNHGQVHPLMNTTVQMVGTSGVEWSNCLTLASGGELHIAHCWRTRFY